MYVLFMSKNHVKTTFLPPPFFTILHRKKGKRTITTYTTATTSHRPGHCFLMVRYKAWQKLSLGVLDGGCQGIFIDSFVNQVFKHVCVFEDKCMSM